MAMTQMLFLNKNLLVKLRKVRRESNQTGTGDQTAR